MHEMFKALGAHVPIFAFSHCRDVIVEVSKAGGLGIYGASLHPDDQIREDLQWIERQLDGLPYGVDLMMPAKYEGSGSGGPSKAELQQSIPSAYTAFLDGMMDHYNVPLHPGWDNPEHERHAYGQRYTAKESAEILRAAFDFNPRILVSALGTPSAEVITEAHARSMLVGALAGKVSHALKHKAAGVDFVVAQSYEAGGHTGDIGGMVLTPLVVDAIAPTPVLAAGGIATGRQMAAALALGASGVWCGTVWLTTRESECSPIMREKLVAATTDDTLRTRCFTGKPARFYRSAWVDEWERPDAPALLPNPFHTAATDRYIERIDIAAARPSTTLDSGVGQLVSKPAGQVVALITSETSCRQVMADMISGCVDALDRVSTGLGMTE